MKHLIFTAFFAAVSLSATAPMAQAGDKIERACLKANRQGTTRTLCGCIQDAADLLLNKRDQTLAAKFFKDPHYAQEVRQSDRTSNEAFWKRYKEFGSTAEAFCRN